MKKTPKQTFMERIADKGGELIAKKVMLQPSLDVNRGRQADKRREQLLRNREYRQNQKAMGY